MIHRLEEARGHAPVPPYLDLRFESCVGEQKIGRILALLRGLDRTRSRGIVFVSSRKGADRLSERLNLELTGSRTRVAPFHAGMTAEQRLDTYERFRRGTAHVLVATKAFGMGLDIPNIHLVIHADVPASLEDYLQEIGRAGRDRMRLGTDLPGASTPDPCYLLATEADFRKATDRLHRDQLSWSEITGGFRVVLDAVGEQPLDGVPVPLCPPRAASGQGAQDNSSETRFRLALYWLERLKRIRVGDRVPECVELELRARPAGSAEGAGPLGLLLEYLWSLPGAQEGVRRVHSVGELSRQLRLSSRYDLFSLLFLAHRAGLLTLCCELTLRVPVERQPEMESAALQAWRRVPSLECQCEAAGILLADLPPGRTVELTAERLDVVLIHARETASGHGARFDMQSAERALAVDGEYPRECHRQRLLRLLRCIPGISIKTRLQDGKLSHWLQAAASGTQQVLDAGITRFRKLCLNILREAWADGAREVRLDLTAWLERLQLPDNALRQLEEALVWLKRAGLLLLQDRLLETAVEVTLLSQQQIDHSVDQSPDARVYAEFEECRRLKKLRLAALQALTVPGVEVRTLIQACFAAGSAAELFQVLEETLPPGSMLLEQLRDEALREELEQLDADQLAVYQAPQDRSAVVLAGPGSGKTHTLLLRMVGLIHEHAVQPEDVLVLAYNRAVVSELRHRLTQLLGKLGYGSLARRVRVCTFHGYARQVLSESGSHAQMTTIERMLADPAFAYVTDRLPDRKLDSRRVNSDGACPVPVPLLIAYFNWLIQTGHRPPRLTAPRFVFVDEFQDVTRERYEALRHIAPPETSAVTVIGDDDQSIYGYERLKEEPGQPQDARRFFEGFEHEYGANRYSLNYNHRSLPQILEVASKLINKNGSRLKTVFSQPARQPLPDAKLPPRYASLISCAADDRLGQLLRHLGELLREEASTGGQYRDIAILFRENADIYWWRRPIEEALRDQAVVQVHPELRNFDELRETAWFRRQWREQGTKSLPPEFPELFQRQLAEKRRVWSQTPLDVLEAVVEQFLRMEDGSVTYGDLERYVEEFASNGSVGKALQHSARSGVGTRPRVVLTNVHRSKGLEFDAVLIPAHTLPLQAADGVTLQDTIEEERRVAYVGLTRARDRLVWIGGERERALYAGTEWPNPGREWMVVFDEGLDDTFVSYTASVKLSQAAGFESPTELQQYLEKNVREGDALSIVDRSPYAMIQHQGRTIGRLSKQAQDNLKRGFGENWATRGLHIDCAVAAVYTWRFDPEAPYAHHVAHEIREAGHFHVVDFTGYVSRSDAASQQR